MGWNPNVRRAGVRHMLKRGVKKTQHTQSGRNLLRTDNSRLIGNKGNLHLFKRTLVVPIVLDRATATADTATGHNIWSFCNSGRPGENDFRLTSLAGYTDFTNLFDRFKICGIKWELSSYNSESDMGNGGAWIQNTINAYGTLKVHTCNDYDDNTPITEIKDMAQYSTYKRTSLQGSKQVKRYVKPRVLIMAYETAITTAYSPKRMYIDCDDADTPHYGLKFIIEEPRTWSADQAHSYLQLELRCTFMGAFKDPR